MIVHLSKLIWILPDKNSHSNKVIALGTNEKGRAVFHKKRGKLLIYKGMN
jgi:hypothetical protein